MGFMSWLEKRARKQCEFNIQINTRTLVAASNRADANLKESGHQVNPGDAAEKSSRGNGGSLAAQLSVSETKSEDGV